MVRLPNLDDAEVAEAKLGRYLLDRAHPDGGPKAKFLFRFGFTPTDGHTLRRALLDHAAGARVAARHLTDFGDVYEIVGSLPSPDGRNPIVRVVWMIDTGRHAPRLITLVPKEE